MKNIKQLLTSIILMLLTWNVAISQTEFKLDSIQRFDWNSNTNAFKMNGREHFTYDNGGTKETYSITSMLTGTVWNPSLRYNKTYNEDNNVIEKVIETYDAVLDIWNASTKEFYTYDSSQNLILFEDSYSSDGGVTWDIPRSEIEYSYNTDNLVTELTRRFYDTTSMTMVNLGQTTTSYNGLHIAEEISRIWSSSSSIWLNSIKIEYTYTGDLPIQKDYFFWQSSDWDTQPYLKVINTYDGNLLTDETSLLWITSGSIWQNNFRTTHTYDTNDNAQEVRTYDWDVNTATWLNLKQELWYWSEAGPLLSVSDEKELNLTIYPNPATDYFTISNLYKKAIVTLFDIHGKRIGDYNLEASQNSKINIDQFDSGLYFLKISFDNETISKKLIVK